MPFFENARHVVVNECCFIESAPVTAGIPILEKYTVAGALHNSNERFDAPKCHPDTRIAVLDMIAAWAGGPLPDSPPVLWLHGPAGAGKSAIAQTIAERWHREDKLAACFFFSRTVPRRNAKDFVIPTIVYQLLSSFPEIRPYIESKIKQDPLIFKKSLECQLEVLVTGAFASSQRHYAEAKVIILDGLDECNGGNAQTEILSAFGIMMQENIPLIWLVASRPEPQMREAFVQDHWVSMVQSLELNSKFNPDADILLFLRCKFEEIRHKRSHTGIKLPSLWPSDQALAELVKKSSGQFIYASTVVKYVGSIRSDPQRCLQVILGLKCPGNDTPYADLDALYNYILSAVCEASLPTVMDIFACLLHGQRIATLLREGDTFGSGLSPAMLERILFLEHGHIYTHLVDLHSLLSVPPPESYSRAAVRLYHASFSDFLADPRRSRHFLGKNEANARMACHLFKHFDMRLAEGQWHNALMASDKLEVEFCRLLYSAAVMPELRTVLEASLRSRVKHSSVQASEMGDMCEDLHPFSCPRKGSTYRFIQDCTTRYNIVKYLQNCNLVLEPSLFRRNVMRQRLFLLKCELAVRSKTCRRGCRHHL